MTDIFDRINTKDIFDRVELSPEDKVIFSLEMRKLIEAEIVKQISNIPIGKLISKVVEASFVKQNEPVILLKESIELKIEKQKKEIEENVFTFKKEIENLKNDLSGKYNGLKNSLLSTRYEFGGFTLPVQTGNSGKYLITNGLEPSWTNLASGTNSLFQLDYANNKMIFGSGAAGVDYAITFDGETNDGTFTWMEDEDYFAFADDILMNVGENITIGNGATGSIGIGGTANAGLSERVYVKDNGLTASNQFVVEHHADDSGPYVYGAFNDTASTTIPGIAYYVDNAGVGHLGNVGNYNLNLFTNGYANPRAIFGSAGNLIGSSPSTFTARHPFSAVSNTSTDIVMAIRRTNATSGLVTAYGTPYLVIGANEYTLNMYETIGFGWTNGTTYTIPPAEIGFQMTSASGGTKGDLVFATRDVTTNTAPTERMRIKEDGKIGIGVAAPGFDLDIQRNSANSGFVGVNTKETANSSMVLLGNLKSSNGTYTLPGIWLNTAAPSFTNYAFLADGSGTYFNAPSGDVINFRIANSTKLAIDTNGNLTLGSGAAGYDYTFSINGETNDFLATWMEDEDVLKVADALTHWLPLATKTAAYTLTANDEVILAGASAAGFTLTLPTAVGITGKTYTIKKTDTEYDSAITIDGSGTETINGNATHLLYTVNSGITIISDGSNWQIIGVF